MFAVHVHLVPEHTVGSTMRLTIFEFIAMFTIYADACQAPASVHALSVLKRQRLDSPQIRDQAAVRFDHAHAHPNVTEWKMSQGVHTCD